MSEAPAGSTPPAARSGRWLAPALALAAALLVAFAALAVYAAPRAGLPWRGDAPVQLAPRLEAAIGRAAPDGEALRLRIDGERGRLLLTAPVQADAGAHRFLRYRFDALPPSLRLAFGWRGAAQPERWQWAPLPFPRGTTHVDLSRLSAGWDGEVVAVALMLLPAELLPADGVAAHELRLLEAALVQDAYAPAVDALVDAWLAYRPWSGRSINTAGFALGQEAPRPPMPWLVLAGAALLLAWGLARRWSGRAWLRGAAVLACAGWLALDLLQLRTLTMRAQHVTAVHRLAGGAPAIEPALARSLAEIGALPVLRAQRRLVVVGANAFLGTYPVFALLPHDAAAMPASALVSAPPGTLVLDVGGALSYREDLGTLWIDGRPVPVDRLHANAHAQLFALRGPGGAER